MNNTLNLGEKITCGKIKSKAKTLLFGQIIYDKNILNNNLLNQINVIKFADIKINFDNTNSNNIELIKSLIIDSTIIISTSPNPKASDSHILVFPGYLSDIKKISIDKLELNIFFNNFFSNNIPINYDNLYFMIWFKKIIPSNIIIKSSIDYYLNKLELSDKNTITIFDSNKYEHKYFFVQQTQTLNVICNTPTKISNTYYTVVKKCIFENMCKGFWIKMSLFDYNNLKNIKLILSGIERFVLRQEQIELMELKQNISNNFIVIFVNLDIENIKWILPSNNNDIQDIYSNSLNCSRIDQIQFEFLFSNVYIHNNIQITSLSLNFLNIKTNNIKFKLFNL